MGTVEGAMLARRRGRLFDDDSDLRIFMPLDSGVRWEAALGRTLGIVASWEMVDTELPPELAHLAEEPRTVAYAIMGMVTNVRVGRGVLPLGGAVSITADAVYGPFPAQPPEDHGGWVMELVDAPWLNPLIAEWRDAQVEPEARL
jgi:hypothetical protein